jgi:hypothetical protein
MKKILFLALFAFMLTGCSSSNGPLNIVGKGSFLLKLANSNSSHLIIDESDIEMYKITRRYVCTSIFTHWIHLNDAGVEKFNLLYATQNEGLVNEEFVIIFDGKELYKGIFVAAPSKIYECYTIDIALSPISILTLTTEPNNPNLVDWKDENKLFAYFDSIGKLK